VKVEKVYLKDIRNIVYLFAANNEIYINGTKRGNGILVTPVSQLTISKTACFILNGKKLQTGPLKGCYVI